MTAVQKQNPDTPDPLIAEIRGFNRFYVDIIGLNQRQFLDGPFTLTEARVLLEIGQNGNNTHGLLSECLRIDNGYLSRLVASFIKDGLVSVSPSQSDGRSKVFSLTAKGLKALAELNEKSNAQIAGLLAHLTPGERKDLVGQFKRIEGHLARKQPAGGTGDTGQHGDAGGFTIRNTLLPGDAGRIIALHGTLYSAEYKYDAEFEAYVAKTLYEFLPGYDAGRDRVWLVERGDKLLGCLAALGKSAELAQLRWFVLSPELRGKGLGKKLLTEAIAFCKEQGHSRIFLETTADLDAAIHLYTLAGFKLVREHTEQTWGKILTHRYYELKL